MIGSATVARLVAGGWRRSNGLFRCRHRGSLFCARRDLMLMIDAWPSAGAVTSSDQAATHSSCNPARARAILWAPVPHWAGSLERRHPRPSHWGQHRKSTN